MKKINIIKENRDYERIITNIRPYRTVIANLYLEETDNPYYHFGISVSKKVGNAVIRNRVKRQIKSILDKNLYQKKFNCIIIVKKEILMKTYAEQVDILNKALANIHIIKGENDNQ